MKNTSRYGLLLLTVFLLGASGGIGGPQEETLYDKDVQLVSFEDLHYPAAARIARVQGIVVVKTALADDGAVS